MAITNRDIEKLKSVFATKNDLQNLKSIFTTKEDLANLKNIFTTKDEFNSFKDQTQSNFDFVFKKLIDIQHEITAFVGLYRRHDEKLENHETRITKLETAKV